VIRSRPFKSWNSALQGQSSSRAGFTFIEVMVAMMIFVMAVLAALQITRGSVQAARETKEVSRANWLLQSVMAELETNLETQGIEKACEKEKKGRFPEPNQEFSWVASCYPVDFKLSETASQLMAQEDGDANETSKENLQNKLILQLASKYITDLTRELHVEVSWQRAGATRTIDLTTHFVKFDFPLSIPAGLCSAGGKP